MYIDILCHLRDVVRKECPENWRTNSWFLLHDDSPAHQSVLVKDFFINEQCDNTGASPVLSLSGCMRFLPIPTTEVGTEGTSLS